MIAVLSKQTDLRAAKLVEAALRRSVSCTQVIRMSGSGLALNLKKIDIIVVINPDEYLANIINLFLKTKKSKVIIFGTMAQSLHFRLGIGHTEFTGLEREWSRSLEAPLNSFSESLGKIQYLQHELLGEQNWDRAFERFDFAKEWNNLGYGAIRTDDSIWSLSALVNVPKQYLLADVAVDGNKLCSYAALYDEAEGSILWFNRSVGPIDSFEWHIVERFIASWRYNELPVLPVLLDLPWGHEAAVTMRLDCDEDISSANELWKMYQEENVPFSLAINAANLDDRKHDECIKLMASQGVAFLSHSLTHAPNWGGSYEVARHEAAASAQKITSVIQAPIRYAVSPFHQNPDYALNALCDVGYQGVIGGIIRNDPDFLIARGGQLADMPNGFIGHSQQVMLHGDCLLVDTDPMEIYKKSFDTFSASKMIFGYLDHPFSSRYQYGWESEFQRSEAHRSLINYVRQQVPSAIFMSENSTMDFILDKSQIQISKEDGRFVIYDGGARNSELIPTLLFSEKFYSAQNMYLSN
ncbi:MULTISPECIES: polysaccharide deacetylase family protein [Rahnella]|uniref:Polysaccharide deacetylase family protein n=1 Tax=Rahnella laticis TaxID=2787622 RepID=A0ABS0E586_9GAMM|nr:MULTISPECIES: polysaccharide deacetylase family protein [Rahnella]MBF7980263.1 polysaccharide deacetylase family protein [Rahnella laticis]MBF8000478.1 polysaccharide deacetylase family protein [Rahnella sp. LAC-M12]